MSEAGKEPNVCPECGKEFDTNQGLGAHRARAHGYRRDEQGQAPPELDHDTRAVVDRMYEVSTSLVEQDFAEANGSYNDKLEEFLPALAEEVRRRKDDSLTEAFFTLYLDAH